MSKFKDLSYLDFKDALWKLPGWSSEEYHASFMEEMLKKDVSGLDSERLSFSPSDEITKAIKGREGMAPPGSHDEQTSKWIIRRVSQPWTAAGISHVQTCSDKLQKIIDEHALPEIGDKDFRDTIRTKYIKPHFDRKVNELNYLVSHFAIIPHDDPILRFQDKALSVRPDFPRLYNERPRLKTEGIDQFHFGALVIKEDALAYNKHYTIQFVNRVTQAIQVCLLDELITNLPPEWHQVYKL